MPIRQMRALEHYFHHELGTYQAFDNFLNKLYERLERIAEYPESGHHTGRKNIRYIRIDAHRSLFYRIRPDRIQIILLWDSRQDPVKNPYAKKPLR